MKFCRFLVDHLALPLLISRSHIQRNKLFLFGGDFRMWQTFFYWITFSHLNASHLLSSYFRNPSPPEDVFAENLERLTNTIESGLAEPLLTRKTVEMRHDVFRNVVKRTVLNLNTRYGFQRLTSTEGIFLRAGTVLIPRSEEIGEQLSFQLLFACFLDVHTSCTV